TSVNRTQSMILIHISNGVTRPSEIAREMGTTRQNIHSMAKHLIDNHIVKLISDPNDRRSKQYAFSDDSQELRDTVLKVLVQLDKKLADRIGKDTMQDLNRALSADWGEPVKEISPGTAKIR
ncbi:MAG: winged helix-turn-helix transcriptional regulator, partial [Gammaproteobacteria bacterium]|nr:winged helix-turn-helix transcriptional regulator [Gammaproteobacteria bacterium]